MTHDEYLELSDSIKRLIKEYDMRRFDYDTGKVAYQPNLDRYLLLIDDLINSYVKED